ncbi:LemA family protein [Candidatus Woesearchaeota archaeon]|nr:LemA family protein [Candidatus Woesearchaeota archaeon]
MIGWIIFVIIVILVLFLVIVYNSLVRLKNEVENSWAQIDVQLKRRFDLIPNLIESVKGYMKHEKGVLTEVTKARTEMGNATTVNEKAKANNMLTETLKSLFAVAENYPKLRANENFLQLQEELSGTENKIGYARQHYNDVVMEMNNKVQTFPSNIIANLFHFGKKELFQTVGKERENIKVSF